MDSPQAVDTERCDFEVGCVRGREPGDAGHGERIYRDIIKEDALSGEGIAAGWRSVVLRLG